MPDVDRGQTLPGIPADPCVHQLLHEAGRWRSMHVDNLYRRIEGPLNLQPQSTSFIKTAPATVGRVFVYFRKYQPSVVAGERTRPRGRGTQRQTAAEVVRKLSGPPCCQHRRRGGREKGDQRQCYLAYARSRELCPPSPLPCPPTPFVETPNGNRSDWVTGAGSSFVVYRAGLLAIQVLGTRRFLALYVLGGAFSQCKRNKPNLRTLAMLRVTTLDKRLLG